VVQLVVWPRHQLSQKWCFLLAASYLSAWSGLCLVASAVPQSWAWAKSFEHCPSSAPQSVAPPGSTLTCAKLQSTFERSSLEFIVSPTHLHRVALESILSFLQFLCWFWLYFRFYQQIPCALLLPDIPFGLVSPLLLPQIVVKLL